MTPSQVYWIAKLDDIRHVFNTGILDGLSFAFLMIAMFLAIGTTIAVIASDGGLADKTREALVKLRRISVILAISASCMQVVCGLATAFIPTTKQATAIMIIPRIANSKTVSDLGDVGSELVVLAKEWLAELHPKKK